MRRLFGLATDIARGNLGRALPFKLTYIVTDECSCRCAICNLWQKPRKGATIDEIDALFGANSHLSWINLSGGEVAERADFAAIVESAVARTRVAVLDFPTAGQRPETIDQAVRAALRTRLPRLFVTVSIDGPRDIHDRLRGTVGAFDLAIETLERLRAIGDSRLTAHVGLTLSSRNDSDPDALVLDLLRDGEGRIRRSDLHYNIAHYAPHYYRNRAVDRPDPARAAAFFDRERARRPISFSPLYLLELLYWRLVPSYLETGDSPVPCSALRASAYVDPDLNLYPCATWDQALLNLRDVGYSLERAGQAASVSAARTSASRRECPGCWTPCEAYPTLLTRGPAAVVARSSSRSKVVSGDPSARAAG